MDELTEDLSPPTSRLAALIELRDELRRQILATHSEHGLQGVSGLVGQYRAALAEIDELKPKEVAGDGIDEIANRRTARRSSSAARPGHAKQSS